MKTSIISRLLVAAALAGGTLMMPLRAGAADFAVSPVIIKLHPKSRSELITLLNKDNQPLRFQLSAFSWTQGPDGQMVQTPTDDVIFFPQLFEVPAHEAQKIRVGIMTPAAEVEKTYRLTIRQLKPFARKTNAGIEIMVLVNLSLPIFGEPATGAAVGRIDALKIDDGTLTVAVGNAGNEHLQAASIAVEGLGGAQTLFKLKSNGGYVLAQNSRNFRLELPADKCHGLTRLKVSVNTVSTVLRSEVAANPTLCISAKGRWFARASH